MKVFNFMMMVAILSLSAFPANAQTSVNAVKEVQNVNASQFKALMSKKDVVVLDVRTAREFAAQKIEGAINMPLNTIYSQVNTLDSSKKYLVYCRSGARSRRAANVLARKGFNVYNLNGGILSWNRQ